MEIEIKIIECFRCKKIFETPIILQLKIPYSIAETIRICDECANYLID
jgi:hypothetical protein